mgnify:CR=1
LNAKNPLLLLNLASRARVALKVREVKLHQARLACTFETRDIERQLLRELSTNSTNSGANAIANGGATISEADVARLLR